MKKYAQKTSIVVAVLALLAMTTTSVQADTITDSFDLGYGYTDGTSWNTSEITNNTSVSGDFELNLTLSGAPMSAKGVTFSDRVLGDNTGGSSCAAKFAVDIEAVYTGDVPDGATITLVIDSISIWGCGTDAYDGLPGENDGLLGIRWEETTTGTTVTTDYLTLNRPGRYDTPGPYEVASLYKQLVWNPEDAPEVADVMTTTRSFNIYSNATYDGDWNGNAALDGFEVSGHIEVEYDAPAVPEPSTLALVLSAIAGLAWIRRRK